MKNLKKTVGVGAGLLVVEAANAAAIGVADLVTDVAAQAVPIGLVGTAVLMILFGIVVFKWVRRTF